MKFAVVGQLGLEFAIVATFIGLIVPQLISRPMVACALATLVTSLLTYTLPHKLGLLVSALVGISVGLLLELSRPIVRRNVPRPDGA